MAREHAELHFVIECRYKDATFCVAWEPIAAFNINPAAKNYAADCARTNPNLEYRVSDVEVRA